MGGLGTFAEEVDQLGGGRVHLDLEALEGAGEVVERHHRRNRDLDAQRGGDECLGNTSGHRRDSTGSRGRDAFEGMDDSDDRAEQADERGRRPDGRQTAQAFLHLGQREHRRPIESPGDQLHTRTGIVDRLAVFNQFGHARRYDLGHVGLFVLPRSGHRVLQLAFLEASTELGKKRHRLVRRGAETAVLVENHGHRVDRQRQQAAHDTQSDETDTADHLCNIHVVLLCYRTRTARAW
jgi:hypothetical protein